MVAEHGAWWLGSRSLRSFSEELFRHAESYAERVAANAIDASRAFHLRAGTFTDGVAHGIDEMRALPLARVAHQPNTFAYSKLLAQLIGTSRLDPAQGTLARAFVYLDYDTVGDQRFAHSVVPRLGSPKGMVSIGLTQRQLKQRSELTGLSAPQDEEWVDHVSGLLRRSALEFSDVAGLSIDPVSTRLDSILEDLRIGVESGRSLAESNAIFLSRLVTLRLGIDLPFIPASSVWESTPVERLSSLYDEWPKLVEKIRLAARDLRGIGIEIDGYTAFDTEDAGVPFWGVCSCHRRVALLDGAPRDRLFRGVCRHCGKEFAFKQSRNEPFDGFQGRLVPKIVVHNALNRTGFGYFAGTAHVGSADHVVTHGLALAKMGLEALPQYLWQPNEFDAAGAWRASGTLPTMHGSHVMVSLGSHEIAAAWYLAVFGPEKVASIVE